MTKNVRFSSKIWNYTVQGEMERGRCLGGQVEDMVGLDPEYPASLTQTAKNMMVLDNQKATCLVNYLRRYFFKESGFVSQT